MSADFHFTFKNLKAQYQKALDNGYTFITCLDYKKMDKNSDNKKLIVNRIDVDFSLKKAKMLVKIFNELNITASFFIRLHAPEYNPFSFESYKIIKEMIDTGHEVGYHSEIVDQAAIWGEDPKECLIRDIKVMETFFNTKIHGVASHGGMTGLNNLDFWANRDASEFGLEYEAYDTHEDFNLFNSSFYISDSEWFRWKCYDKGTLVENDNRSFGEHIDSDHKLICLLIHSDTYFNEHFYE